MFKALKYSISIIAILVILVIVLLRIPSVQDRVLDLAIPVLLIQIALS